jgi:hypothetical protein
MEERVRMKRSLFAIGVFPLLLAMIRGLVVIAVSPAVFAAQKSVCTHIKEGWGWQTGQVVNLAEVQNKLRYVPSPISVMPRYAMNAIFRLTVAPRLTFHCQDAVDSRDRAIMYFTYQGTDQVVRTPNVHIKAHSVAFSNSLCRRMPDGWGWRDGQLVSLAYAQNQLKHSFRWVTLSPYRAVSEIEHLKGVTHLIIHCVDSSFRKDRATIYFTYREGEEIKQTSDITVSLTD